MAGDAHMREMARAEETARLMYRAARLLVEATCLLGEANNVHKLNDTSARSRAAIWHRCATKDLIKQNLAFLKTLQTLTNELLV